MAKNQVLPTGLELALPVPEGTKSGEPVIVGSLVGVAITDRGAIGNLPGEATVWRHRSWELPVDGEVTEPGTPVYIIRATRKLTTTAEGNVLFGYALETKAAAEAPVHVVIAQV